MPKPNQQPKPFAPKDTTPAPAAAPAPAPEAQTPPADPAPAPAPDETSPQNDEGPKEPAPEAATPDTPPADPTPAEPSSPPVVGEAEVTGEDDDDIPADPSDHENDMEAKTDRDNDAADQPVPMEVTGLNGNPEREDGVFMPKARYDALRRKLREASEARDMWDARARAKEAYDML